MRPTINPFALLSVFVLSGCATLTGTYELKAYDNTGKPIQMRMRMIAEGRGIYTARNAICIAHPGATVTIVETRTKQELAGESPHRCR